MQVLGLSCNSNVAFLKKYASQDGRTQEKLKRAAVPGRWWDGTYRVCHSKHAARMPPLGLSPLPRAV